MNKQCECGFYDISRPHSRVGGGACGFYDARTLRTTMTLPDCMMPDGDEPCRAYQELEAENFKQREVLNGRIRALEAGIETVAQYCDQQADYADENMEGPSGLWFGKCAARLRVLLY